MAQRFLACDAAQSAKAFLLSLEKEAKDFNQKRDEDDKLETGSHQQANEQYAAMERSNRI
jgi:hypothetical protein